MTPADKSLALVIRKAQWMGKGKPPATELLSETSHPLQDKKTAAKEKNTQQQSFQSNPSTP
jgi:hypothetical protein